MAIEFIVETGEGLTNSTSYVSIDEFKQYHLNRGTDYSSLADDKIQASLNIATEYIDSSYNFKGYMSVSNQALAFPRFDIGDVNIIPAGVKLATCYLAEKALDENIFDEIDENIVSESIGGQISKTYKGKYNKSYRAVEKYLSPYIASAGYERVN